MNKADYQTFINMLTDLNRFIFSKYDPQYILEVRAIGGFSMIIYKRLGIIDNPREKSRDIDTLTNDYPAAILEEIKRIGERYGIDDVDGWLNNHWNRTKNYNDEFAFFIRWQKLEDVSFSNINVYYADLESLFMFKIRAMDDRINLARLEPREQDVVDVASMLRAFDINNTDNISNELIRNTMLYFPYAVNYLLDIGIVAGTKRDISAGNQNDPKRFEETEYAQRLISQAKEYSKALGKS